MSDDLTLDAMLNYETVQIWLDGLREHWGGDPATDDPGRLPTMEEFCQFAGADPDTISWAENQLGVPVIDHWWQTETGGPPHQRKGSSQICRPN